MSETTDPPEDSAVPEPEEGGANSSSYPEQSGLGDIQVPETPSVEDQEPPEVEAMPLEDRELPSDVEQFGQEVEASDFEPAEFEKMDGAPAALPVEFSSTGPDLSSTANPTINWGSGTRTLKNLKVPPHSLEAERAVLGGVMLDNGRWDSVDEVVASSDFYRPQHQLIFDAMRFLAEDNQPLDVVTVSTRLQHSGALEKAGSAIYIAEIAEETPGASNVVAYAKIVRERSTLRQLLGAANRIAESAFNPDGQTTADLVNSAEAEIFRISEGDMKEGGPQPVIPLLAAAVKKVETLFTSRKPITGLETGFVDLDRMTAGLQMSDLVIIAARPSMGKTALSINIAEHAVMSEGEGAVLFFSMEQPADQIVMRMLSSLGRIDQTRMRTGDLQDEDWERFTSAVSQLKDKQLFVDDSPALSPIEVRTRARRVARDAGGKLKLIVVDYMQLMRGSSEKSENRTNEISEISRSLKAIAKEMNCPLIALSQLNRALESRENKRPVMSDLRESGAIEQDADVILFIYRDEVYYPESEDKGKAELIVSKQRNGPIGGMKLKFTGNLTKFDNLANERYEDFE